ncbi:hypothetical protein GGR92_001245 [Spirosoma lacussanchae]|uniref:DUF997 family protein n=1 Tax=Spirosoma sordidisoli TaxID=2502893 RepID=A0A4Q2UX43_9BACT|nr:MULTISPECIES: hypothetical protein [Spirosoma]RYC71589.1 hypothetical protein EQG79_05480 [Spirosoma sordidisoli]
MNAIKKYAGIVWLALAAVVGYYGLTQFGLPKLTSGKTEDLVFGIIILFVLLPIIVGGLVRFGLYALQGEYDDEVS